MEEDDEYRAPFWLPSNDSFRRRDSLPFSFNSSAGFVVLLLAAAVAFLLLGVPSLSSHVFSFRPQSVQKSWDYLNLVLVLFAVLCGFLSRNSNGGGDSARSVYGDYRSFNSGTSQKSNPSTPHDRWHEFSDRSPYGRSSSFNRMRSSSSYPDLRQQESAWSHIDDRTRFSDDTRIYQSRRWREEEEEGEERSRYGFSDFQSKTIHVDRVEVHRQEVPNDTSPAPREPSPPPPTAPARAEPISPPPKSPPRPKVGKRRPKRVHDAVAESHVLSGEPKDEQVKIVDTYKLPPPPPPLPPSPLYDYYSEQKTDSNEKKRGGLATKDFLTVLRRKKKKQRQKSVESFDFDSLFGSSNNELPPPTPPPPPPPLPPPPSVFQNLFSTKKGRAKKSQHGPPPPPPPPPSRVSKTRSQAAFSQSHSNPPIAATKPAPTVNSSRYEYADNRTRSRLIPIPPPPPPPPFKVPEWKFVVQGDYARIRSAHTSRSNSPDPIDEVTRSGVESPSSASVASSDATEPIWPAQFCPSPDVDTKADNFIARFRAGLQLEKVNSMKQRTKSNLGPDPNLDPGPQSV